MEWRGLSDEERAVEKSRCALADEFRCRVSALVVELGGTAAGNPSSPEEMVLPTLAGRLRVEPMTRVAVWVACRFEDVAAGVALLGAGLVGCPNPASGKWNFHFDDGAAIDTNMDELRLALLRVVRGQGR